MEFFGGDQRESFAQIKPRLRAEEGPRARARAVVLRLALVQHAPEQIQILHHRRGAWASRAAASNEGHSQRFHIARLMMAGFVSGLFVPRFFELGFFNFD